MEYLIERTDGEWFELPYASYPDVLHPISFPWQRAEGWGDHRICVLGCDIAFSDEPPGLQISFEGNTVSRTQAQQIVAQIAQNITAATGQTACVVEIT